MTPKHLAFLFLCLLTGHISSGQTCTGNLGFNLNPEGDFGFGEDNIRPDTLFFGTNLIYTQNFPPADSSFVIANSTAGWSDFAANFWIETGDNSGNPNGYMMVINGVAGVFYERTLDVCGATTYQFSFDVINLVDPNQAGAPLPNLELLVDGVPMEVFGNIAQDGQWHNFSIAIDKGINTNQISIALNNTTADSLGNDFAIDNISLQMCQHSTTVNEVNAQPHCPGDAVPLSAANTPVLDEEWFQWQISTNAGQNWSNFSAPTNNADFTADNIPPVARFRVISGHSEGDLQNPACQVFSDNEVILQYNPPETCANAIISVGDRCEGTLGPNIFPNGDFGSGTEVNIQNDPGLAPGYIYQPLPPPDDGLYTITNNTTDWGGFAADSWIDIGDNSDDPNGYMMVVNASSEPGLFFEQTVQICENTTYEFSADVISMNIPGLFDFQEPNISFLIDGVELFATGNVPVDSTWRTFGFSFTSAPGVSQITLALRNNSPGGFDFPGNDLAIDNISLRTCGPTITVPETVSICDNDPFDIVATITDGVYADPFFQWQFSDDDGATWNDLTNENALTLTIDDTNQSGQYRLLAANGASSISQPNCRVVSNPVIVDVQSIETNISETRCEGETYSFGNQNITTTGSYTEVFTTIDGCDSTVVLNIEFTPIINESLTEFLCEGQSYSLGNQTITSTGMYTETFEEPSGCNRIVTLDITFTPPIVQNIAETICQGESFTFGNDVLNEAGNYQQILTSVAGCDSTINLELFVLPNFNMSETAQICAGESFQGSIYTQDTTLTANFTSANGCDSIITTQLTVLPSYNEIFSANLCAGEVFQGTTIQNDTTILVQMSTQAGCDSIITFNVTVENPTGFQIQGLNQICSGETTTLSANNESFVAYQWSTGATTPTIDISTADNYAVEITTVNGCIANDQIEVSVTNLQATATATNPVCPDDNGRIRIDAVTGGTAPYFYGLAEQGLSEQNIIGGLSPGIYEVLVQDAGGCEWQDVITIEPSPILDVNITAPEQLNLGDSAMIEVLTPFSVASYAWSPTLGLSCTDCPNPVVTPDASTAYNLTIMDERGCTISERIFINVVVIRNIFVPNAFSPNGDGINDELTLFADAKVANINTFVIYDRWGNQMYAVDNQNSNSDLLSWDGTFNGKEVNIGVYVWIAEVEYSDGFVETLTGDVALIR